MIEVIGNPKYKRVYISGPITGMPNENKEAFQKYEDKFRNIGLEPVNPHKLFTEKELIEFEKKLKNDEERWAAFMKKDIAELVNCDLIAVLPGWEKSKGANIEVRIARDLFMPIIDATNLQELF